MQNTSGFSNPALPVYPNYVTEVKAPGPIAPKKNRWVLFGVSILVLVTIIIIMVVLIIAKKSKSNIAYGDFEGKVDYSYELDHVLTYNYDLAGREAITEALEDYFLPIYPSGIGLSLVRYETFGDYASFRVVSSFGEFENFVVRKGGSSDTLKIILDEYESERRLDYQKYNDEEFDDD